jgi:hypothetical protein
MEQARLAVGQSRVSIAAYTQSESGWGQTRSFRGVGSMSVCPKADMAERRARSLPPGQRTRPCIGQQFGQIVSPKYRFRVRTQPRLWAGARDVLRAAPCCARDGEDHARPTKHEKAAGSYPRGLSRVTSRRVNDGASNRIGLQFRARCKRLPHKFGRVLPAVRGSRTRRNPQKSVNGHAAEIRLIRIPLSGRPSTHGATAPGREVIECG